MEEMSKISQVFFGFFGQIVHSCPNSKRPGLPKEPRPKLLCGFRSGSDLDLCAHQLDELADDRGVAGPCGRGDQVAVDNGFIHADGNIGAACNGDVRADCGKAVAL